MIEITRDIKTKYRKAFRSARKDRMRVVWLENDLVYVARRAKGHGQYLVRFFVVPRVSGDPQIKMQCNTITGGPCNGTRWHEMCSHMAKVILRGKPASEKKQVEAA